MDLKEYELMFRVEETHWWFKGMQAITRRMIETYCDRGTQLKILDAGCGTGSAMTLLSDYGHVTGFDISPYAIHLCEKRGSRNILRGSVMAFPFADESFDLITSFDVLYFENVDDETAIRESARVLVSGGRMILRVPAFDWLRGSHDLKVSTGHRYTLKELKKKLSRNGLEIEFINYANMILFPLVLLKRFSERFLPTQRDSDIAINLGSLSQLFERCLVSESRLITKYRFPFGISLVAVGRKAIT